MKMRRWILAAVLVLCVLLSAQTHVTPALDTVNVFTAANNFTGGLSINGTLMGTPTGTAGAGVVLATSPSLTGGTFAGPTITTPTISAPTINSGATINGAVTFSGTAFLTNAGVFTNTQNEYLKSTIGTCNSTTETGRFNAGGTLTASIVGCVGLPGAAAVSEAAAVAGFATSSSAGAPFAVGLFGQGACLAVDSKCVGFLSVTGDVGAMGATGDVELFGGIIEIFQNSVAGAYQNLQGLGITGVFAFAPPSFAQAINIQGVGFPWPTGLFFADGSASVGAEFGSLTAAGTNASMSINFHGVNAGVPTGDAKILANSAGSLILTAPAGSAIRVGTAQGFGAYPACIPGSEGNTAVITDSLTNVWGATITAGGANHVFGYCDGTNWTVMGK